jgi:hypothetical protein
MCPQTRVQKDKRARFEGGFQAFKQIEIGFVQLSPFGYVANFNLCCICGKERILALSFV